MVVIKTIRQIIFILSGTLFRLPILCALFFMGKLNLIKLIFQVYPNDELETRDFCPAVPVFRNFFSARPTFGGFITEGIRPIGIYVVIPDTVQDLAKRENKEQCHKIVTRLRWLHRFTGATAIGLAGQLGFIFEKRHGICIKEPLYGSLYGAVFSLKEAIYHAMEKHDFSRENLKIGILGMGDIGKAISRYLEDKGFPTIPLNVKYTKSRRIKLKDEKEAQQRIKTLDLLVNITPTGEDFLQTHCHEYISPHCVIIDFARPGIALDKPQTIYMGNRVRRKGLNFVLSLPGGWDHHDIPACCLASLVSGLTESPWSSIDSFCKIAERNNFFVTLENP